MTTDDFLRALALERCQYYVAQLCALSHMGKQDGELQYDDYAHVLSMIAEKLNAEFEYLLKQA